MEEEVGKMRKEMEAEMEKKLKSAKVKPYILNVPSRFDVLTVPSFCGRFHLLEECKNYIENHFVIPFSLCN